MQGKQLLGFVTHPSIPWQLVQLSCVEVWTRICSGPKKSRSYGNDGLNIAAM